MRLQPLLLLVGLLAAACGGASNSNPGEVALKTQPAGSICMNALAVGVLAVDSESGVGLQAPGGATRPLVWPAGWTARQDGGAIAIIDANAAIVAHVGDTVTIGGGYGADADWFVCPPVQVIGPGPT